MLRGHRPDISQPTYKDRSSFPRISNTIMSSRKAVCVILTRIPESREIYLVERNPKLRFFGGYFAFPGGTLDAEDSEVAVALHTGDSKEDAPYLVAAAREIFEETGILLCGGAQALSVGQRREYRRQLLAEKITFNEFLSNERLSVDSRNFNFIATLLTPEFAPVRYDTRFYWAQIPEGQNPEILLGELVDGRFCDAQDTLRMWRADDILLVPPAVFILAEVAQTSLAGSMAALDQHAQSYAAGAIHEIYFTPGVQMLPLKTRTLLPATHTNSYLVGDQHLYLIDPAPADSAEQQRLWDYLDKRIAEGQTLAAILLTHHHSDHTGAVAQAQTRYQLPVYAHPLTADRIAPLVCDRFLHDKDELDLGASPDGQPGWKLTALHTPGHASGHLAFQESRYGAVIAGDMVSTLSTIVINPPDGHLGTYMNSLHRLRDITTGTIYPSHGPAMQTGRDVLTHFIEHRQAREQKLLAALGSQAQSSAELLAKVYDDVDRSVWPLAELSLRAGLQKLIEEKKCRQVGDAYVAF